jgi:hypothetical protein
VDSRKTSGLLKFAEELTDDEANSLKTWGGRNLNARPEEMDVPEMTRSWRSQLIHSDVLPQLFLRSRNGVKSSSRPNIGVRYWNFGSFASEQSVKADATNLTTRTSIEEGISSSYG